MSRPKLILFTDLDGTLLDHHTYTWEPARPALARIRQAGIPLILNSSKTAAEIQVLRNELDNRDPYIVENGAAVVIPANTFADSREQVINFGASRSVVLSVLNRLRAAGARFRGFEDMTAEELADETGLDIAAASRAKQRYGTEPLLWLGSDDELEQFQARLAGEKLRLVKGGRFWHAMGVFDKADGARFLLRKYQERYTGEELVAIALGDSPNDQRLLESADIAVVIRGVNSDEVQLPSSSHPVRSLRPGPEGWNDCVLNLLFEYGY
jgi:mannosyl-3-phosphoglycerate phosphatase